MQRTILQFGAYTAALLAFTLLLRFAGEASAGVDIYGSGARRFLIDADAHAGGMLLAAFAMLVAPLFVAPVLVAWWHVIAAADRAWGAIGLGLQAMGYLLLVGPFIAFGLIVQVADRFTDAAGVQQDAYANDAEILAGFATIGQQAAFGAIGAGLALCGWLLIRSKLLPAWIGWLSLVFGVVAFAFTFSFPLVIALHPVWAAAMAWGFYQASRRKTADLGPATMDPTPEPRSPWQSRSSGSQPS